MSDQIQQDRLNQQDRLRGFLAGLTGLRLAFGMQVGGCGECGSAWVDDVLVGQIVGQELEWDESRNDWKFSQGSILTGDEPMR
jgi:hypothetical protein